MSIPTNLDSHVLRRAVILISAIMFGASCNFPVRVEGHIHLPDFLFGNCKGPSQGQSEMMIIANKWQSLKTVDEDGLLGERIDLWRNNRLWYIAESGYLIDGFEKRPGTHPWQGEHIGKWLAFTYGPFALSQKIDVLPDQEPFFDSGIEEIQEVIHRLEKSSDSDVAFTVKGTEITLIPYYLTGSEQSGSRTYFEL